MIDPYAARTTLIWPLWNPPHSAFGLRLAYLAWLRSTGEQLTYCNPWDWTVTASIVSCLCLSNQRQLTSVTWVPGYCYITVPGYLGTCHKTR